MAPPRRGPARAAGGLPSTTAQECDRCQGDSEGSLMFPCGRQVTLCIACTTMFTDFLQGRLHGAGRDQLQAPPSPPRLGVQPCVRHSARPSTASGHSSSSRQPDSSPGRPPSAHLAAAKTGKEGHHTQPAFVSPIESHLERAAALYGSPQRRYMGSEARLGRERRDKHQSSIVLQSPMKKGDQYVGKEPHRGAQLQEEGLSSSMGGRQNAPDARPKVQKMRYDSLSSPARQGIVVPESTSAADGDSRTSSQSSGSRDLSRSTTQEAQDSNSSSSDEQIITPTSKSAAMRAGSWRAAAGELLQVVEPVPPSNAHTNERSRIAAVRIFGKPNNRPTSAGFPKKWPSERNRKEHADAVAALAGNGHQVNTTRAANNSVACLLHSRDLSQQSSICSVSFLQNDGRPSGNEQTVEEPSINSAPATRTQPARPQSRFARPQSAVNKNEGQNGVQDLPPGSPVLMKTGSVCNMSFVFGEGLVGDNEKAAASPEHHKSVVNSFHGGAGPRKRVSETMPGTRSRPASRAQPGSNQEEVGPASPHTNHKGSVPRRLASATRKVPPSTGWVDISPASRSSAWANARPGTALGNRPNTSIGGRVPGGSAFSLSAPSSSLSFSHSFSGKAVVVNGELLPKKADDHATFWKGASHLGYRKRSAIAESLPTA